MKLRAVRLTPIAATATLCLATVACGGSDSAETTNPTGPVGSDVVDSDPPATTPPDEPAVTNDPLDVEFASEPIEAGPLFGSPDAAGSADSSDESSDDLSAENDGQLPPNSGPTFQLAPDDAPFCLLLEDLEGRPFPSDDSEAALVANVWIGQLRSVAVDDIVGDLDAMLEFLDDVIASGGQITLNDPSDEVLDAADNLNDYVDRQCFGQTGSATTSEISDVEPTGE